MLRIHFVDSKKTPQKQLSEHLRFVIRKLALSENPMRLILGASRSALQCLQFGVDQKAGDIVQMSCLCAVLG